MQKITVLPTNLDMESANKSHFCIQRNHGECKKKHFTSNLNMENAEESQLDQDTACQQM